MTKEPAELETMKTKLRFPSPTSLTVKSEKLLASLDEREGTDFMYSIRDFSLSGRKSEKAILRATMQQTGNGIFVSLFVKRFNFSFQKRDATMGEENVVSNLTFYMSLF